jgi:Kef-type K+ transport system membrane component KefB
MHEESLVLAVVGAVELLLLASLSAVVFRRIRFPYTIGLVVVGVLLALAPEDLRALSRCATSASRPTSSCTSSSRP